MRISVVIPSYNRRHTLGRAIQSVIDQTSAVEEIILVDDGSTDNTSEVISRDYPQVSIIQQPNRGVSAARNRGIAAASHEWIALLDSDDSWQSHKIARVREAQEKHSGFVLYHSNEIWIRRGVRVNPMIKHGKAGGWIFHKCLALCAISPSATVVKKSILESLGSFDEELPACEDYDLWLRLCNRYPVHYIDETLITRYGGHQDQLSRRFWGMDRFRIRALDRLLRQEKLKTDSHQAARNMLLSKLEILLKGAVKHRNQQILDEFGPLQDEWRDTRGSTLPC